MNSDRWWLRLRFVEGGWELVDQTQSAAVAAAWDDAIDEKEARTGIDHEWLVSAFSMFEDAAADYSVRMAFPYGARPTREEAAPQGGNSDAVRK